MLRPDSIKLVHASVIMTADDKEYLDQLPPYLRRPMGQHASDAIHVFMAAMRAWDDTGIVVRYRGDIRVRLHPQPYRLQDAQGKNLYFYPLPMPFGLLRYLRDYGYMLNLWTETDVSLTATRFYVQRLKGLEKGWELAMVDGDKRMTKLPLVPYDASV